MFRQDMHYIFDTEFGLRLALAGVMPGISDDELAVRLWHEAAKSWDRRPAQREELKLLRLHPQALSRVERLRCWDRRRRSDSASTGSASGHASGDSSGVRPSAVAESRARLEHRPASLVFNTVVMTASSAVSLVINTGLAIYAIRTFSVEEYGHFAIALALIGIFGLLSETGISTVALRSMSTDQAGEAKYLGLALVCELVTSLVVAPLMVPVGLLLGYPSEVIVAARDRRGVPLLPGLPGRARRSFPGAAGPRLPGCVPRPAGGGHRRRGRRTDL